MQPWQRPCITAVMWDQERTTPHGDGRLPGRRWSRSSSSCSRRSPGGSRPDRLAGVRPQVRVQRHTVDRSLKLRLVPALDAPVPLVVGGRPRFRGGAGETGRGDGGPARGHDPRGGPRCLPQTLRLGDSGANRKRKKRRKKKLPKASSGRRPASDSVHRQTLDLPVAAQRQVRTVQTVQVTGDSTVRFLGEVADAPVVVQRLVPGMVQTAQKTVWRWSRFRRTCGHKFQRFSGRLGCRVFTSAVLGQGLWRARAATTGVMVQTVQKTVRRFPAASRSRSWCTSTTDHGEVWR